MNHILLIQGPNLVALGHREPRFYGTTTAAELDEMLRKAAPGHGLSLDIRYLSHEGEAIEALDDAEAGGAEGLIMNPAGFLYAGHALLARLQLFTLPFVEVHITNIELRGKQSVTAQAADGMIAGLGPGSYVTAIQAMRALLDK
jgi:3-dehydroquinate dehydratase-2